LDLRVGVRNGIDDGVFGEEFEIVTMKFDSLRSKYKVPRNRTSG